MAPPLPPGFVVQGQQAGPPALPPGFVIQGQEPAQSTGDIFREQLRAPLERAHPTQFPEHVGQAVREVVTEDIPQAVGNALDVSGTQFRNIAQLRGKTLGAMGEPFGLGEFGREVGSLGIDPATPDAQAQHRAAVIDMLMTTGGAKVAGDISRNVFDAAKYLGRGGQSLSGATRFLERNAAHMTPEGAAATAKVSELVRPALGGGAVAAGLGALFGPYDPTPWEVTDAALAGAAGLATTAKVGKNAMIDLLLGNPKWRSIVMSPSKGTAATILGGVLGHMAAQGIEMTAETISDAVDRVEQRMEGDAKVREEPRPYNPGTPLPLPAMGETRRY